MKITCFFPYGLNNSLYKLEYSYALILLIYLKHLGLDIAVLQCDGALPLCSMKLSSSDDLICNDCIKKQTAKNQELGFNAFNLGDFVEYQQNSTIQDQVIFQQKLLEKHNLSAQFNFSLSQSVKTINSAFNSFVQKTTTDLFILVGNDFVTEIISESARQKFCKHVLFIKKDNGILVQPSWIEEIYQTEVLVDSPDKLRNDPTTWSNELLENLKKCVDFLNIQTDQLTLPLFRN